MCTWRVQEGGREVRRVCAVAANLREFDPGNARAHDAHKHSRTVPAGLLGRGHALFGREPVRHHVGLSKGVQLLGGHVRAVAAVEVAEDEEAAGLGDAQRLAQAGLLGVGVHKGVLREAAVKGALPLLGHLHVGARGDGDALVEPERLGALHVLRVLVRAQVYTPGVDAGVLAAEVCGGGARARAEVDVLDVCRVGLADDLHGLGPHPVGHVGRRLAVGARRLGVNAVPLAKVDVVGAVAHDFGVEGALVLRVVLLDHTHLVRPGARA